MPHLRLMDVNQEWHLLFCHSFLPLARHWCPVLVGTPEVLFLYQHISYSIWYTRSAFPVTTHLLFHLVHQKRVSCTNTSLIPFGTPEARFLYQRHLFVHLVHQKHVSCTNGAPQYIRCITKASSRTFSVLWNNRRPVLPGMKSYAHLKQHSLDN